MLKQINHAIKVKDKCHQVSGQFGPARFNSLKDIELSKN